LENEGSNHRTVLCEDMDSGAWSVEFVRGPLFMPPWDTSESEAIKPFGMRCSHAVSKNALRLAIFWVKRVFCDEQICRD
jgi:hypothetical protein